MLNIGNFGEICHPCNHFHSSVAMGLEKQIKALEDTWVSQAPSLDRPSQLSLQEGVSRLRLLHTAMDQDMLRLKLLQSGLESEAAPALNSLASLGHDCTSPKDLLTAANANNDNKDSASTSVHTNGSSMLYPSVPKALVSSLRQQLEQLHGLFLKQLQQS